VQRHGSNKFFFKKSHTVVPWQLQHTYYIIFKSVEILHPHPQKNKKIKTSKNTNFEKQIKESLIE
jgi:hypothetical protein